MITILAALFVFGVLVTVHEFGHFITAKMTGMRVDEFAIGFGPNIIQKKYGETLYSLRIIPLGGYNKIAGMEPDEPADEGAFKSKPIPSRMLVILAGVLMNFILPVVLFTGIFAVNGLDLPVDKPVLGGVMPGKAAVEAGLQPGDRIIAVGGKQVATWNDMVLEINSYGEKEVVLSAERNGVTRDYTLKPEYDKDYGKPLVGISPQIEHKNFSIFESLKMGFKYTEYITLMMLDGLYKIVTGAAPADVTGPIGIAKIAGEAAENGWMPLLNLTALLSINLGIINLLPLPALDGGSEYLSLTDQPSARKRLASGEPVARVYTKNAPFTGLTYSTNLYVGDYAASNSMEELAEQSEGVRRIAVCRMDVDNLGHAFISGFEQENEKDPFKRMHYVTLSRTSAFSRQMSLFFKCYINGILEGLQVSIVYAGGDDVFLVGAWNDVLEAAQRIQSNFTAFSCGALTLSAGIGIFDDHYPIRLSAEETAALEEAAKHLPGKNAVALFTPERKAVRDAKGSLLVQPEQGHIYAWDVFRTKVLTEKVGCLQSFFGKDNAEHGNAMLYNLLALLREAENDRINLARYAYLLARLSPKKNAPDYKLYEQFSHNMMDWALDAVQRHQLITAIYIYVYQNRKGGDTDGRME